MVCCKAKLILQLLSIGATLIVAASVTSSSAAGKSIDGVAARKFSFGAMAIGQAKDVDYARAEGLGLVPAPAFNAYLNTVLAKLLAQSPVTAVPAKVYVRASGDWAAKTTADANIYVALGTLLRLDDEDEVAALLAHETAQGARPTQATPAHDRARGGGHGRGDGGQLAGGGPKLGLDHGDS